MRFDSTEKIMIKLLSDPYIRYTNTNLMVASAKAISEYENLNLVAWQEKAEKLNEFLKGSKFNILGYRKFNNFNKLEEFIITGFPE